MFKYYLILVFFTASLFADDNLAWKSLPKETILALKFDFSEDVISEIQKNTKLGRQVLDPERFKRYLSIVEEHSLTNPKLAFLLAELRSAGFKPSDLLEVFKAKIGMALIPEKHDRKDYFSLIAWAELKEGMSEKIFLQLKEKASGEALKLEGHEALIFRKKHDSSSSIVFNLKNKLFFINSDLDGKAKNKIKGKADLKQRAFISDLCNKVSAGYVDTLKNKNTQSGTLPLPSQKNKLEGRPVFDFYVDFEKIFNFAVPNNRDLKNLGLDGLKCWSGAVALNKNSLTAHMNVEAPNPRRGLLSFIDQPKIPSRPPEWVPADIVNYHHMSFDAHYMLQHIKKMMSVQVGSAAVEKQFKGIDLKLQAFLGIKLGALLEAFDKQIIMLDYGVDFETETNSVLPESKIALVLGFENNMVMNKVIDILTPFAEDSGVKRADQLGFKGFSVNVPDFNGGLYMGHKSIVLTIGQGTQAKVLKAISQPQASLSLVQSTKYKSFLKNYKISDSVFFSYGDQSHNGIVFYKFLRNLIKKSRTLESMEKRDRLFWKSMIQNLPSEETLEGIFGISFGTAYTNEHGLTLEGKIELP